jgi:reticulon-1
VVLLVSAFSRYAIYCIKPLTKLSHFFQLVEGRVKNTDGSNPFKPYLEQEVTVPQDRVHAQVDVLVEHAQLVATQLRRLFLVEHLVDSVKVREKNPINR